MSISPLTAAFSESASHLSPALLKRAKTPYKTIDAQKIFQALEKSPRKIDPLFSQKIFAHIVGNDFLGQSHLNGASFYDTLRYAKEELLRAYQGEYGIDWNDHEKRLMEESMDELSTAFEVFLKWRRLLGDKTLNEEQFLNSLKRHVALLKRGGSLLIPGGWSGHGILYEITRTPNDHYHFHIFNSGSGLIFHPTRMIHKKQQQKKQSLCRLLFDLGAQPTVLNEALTQVVKLQQTSTKASGKYQYFKLLRWLVNFSHHIEPSDEDSAWMSPQKSSICAWRSIMVWQRTKFQPSTQKTLQLCAKVRAFNQITIQHPSELKPETFLYTQVFQPALSKLTLKLKEAGLENRSIVEKQTPPNLKKTIWIKTKENFQILARFLLLFLENLWVRIRSLAYQHFTQMA